MEMRHLMARHVYEPNLHPCLDIGVRYELLKINQRLALVFSSRNPFAARLCRTLVIIRALAR